MQLKWPMLWDLFSLFPAHAGVIPGDEHLRRMRISFPRTRGGDPVLPREEGAAVVFSPHTRG